MAPSRQRCKQCGNVTLRISWSGLRVQEECNEKGFHKRGRSMLKQPDQRVFFPGTVLDRVVRDWLVDGPEKDTMPDMVTDIVDREWKNILDEGGSIAWKDAQDKAKVIADVRLATQLIQPALVKYVLPYDYQADFKFQAPVKVPHPAGGHETVILIGAMDITVRDDHDRFWVWDVKMTRDDDYWRKTQGQLTFYDLVNVILHGKGTVRTGLLQPLCKEPIKAFEITNEKRADMLMRIAAMARSIWLNERIPRQDTKLCNWCEAKGACSKFQPVVHADGKRRLELF